MPPRSYYNAPRCSDYLAFAESFFAAELDLASEFVARTGLPYIATSAHVASYIGLSPSIIRQILHRPSFHYRNFDLKKKSGGVRRISTPRTYLKVVQWWIADNILVHAPLGDCLYGFRRGTSYIDNAKRHVGKKHILNVDIKSFFENIDTISIANAFSYLGYSQEGSLVLAALTSLAGYAPTGAPTSPMLANIVLRDVDLYISNFCNQNNIVYTRYADDLTFSSDEWLNEDLVVEVEKIIGKYGFSLNPKKTKFMGSGNRQEVTGLIVNSSINTSKKWRNGVRGFLHSLKYDPEKLIANYHKVSGIYGTLIQVDPEKNNKLTRLADEVMVSLKALRSGS